MNKTKLIKNRRLRLWKKNPHCCFCGCLTILPDAVNGKGYSKDNWATIEHLRSRLNPTRHEPNISGKEIRTILACSKCNNERNKIEEANLGKEELTRRSRGGRDVLEKMIQQYGSVLLVPEIKKAYEEAGTTFEQLIIRKHVKRAQSRFLMGRIPYSELLSKIVEAKNQ